MNKILSSRQFQTKKAGIAILVLLHIVGVIGFLSPLSEWFIYLTPATLLITAGTLFLDTKAPFLRAFLIALLIWAVGYGAELIGVKTGIIFGEYAYGEVLGWKIAGVPPLIGINWLIVIWGAFSLGKSLNISSTWRWLFTGVLATGFDYLMEPVAIRYGLWHWYGEEPLLENYLTWFVLASVLGAVFEKYPLVRKPRLGLVAFICQILFFGALRAAMVY